MNGCWSVMVAWVFFWGIYTVSFVLYMVELYLLQFRVKKEADWSHRSEPVICVHTNVVFSPRNPDSRFITLEKREPEKTVLVLTFTYHKSHIKAIDIMGYVHISISQHVDWQGKGLRRQSILSASLAVLFYWTRPVMIHIFTTDPHILRGID